MWIMVHGLRDNDRVSPIETEEHEGIEVTREMSHDPVE
jgi:hypothetical protein